MHLKFGKGGVPGGTVCSRLCLHGSPQLKLTERKKVSKPQVGRQIPLEMGTGGGVEVEVRKEEIGSKRPPEDKIDIEDHPSEGDEDDSSSETSLELDFDPQTIGFSRT